ncbi:MAG: hypothetical protein K1X53_03015 [Candidatus Sumerlaeaceae bacterium]|nr:hypothetical protein [Candidatus Sumerlaeaceae bacterium]
MLRTAAICTMAASAIAFASSANALTLDGLVSDLGSAQATDAVLPTSGEGGAGPNAVMDLSGIYAAEDSGTINLALTIAADIGATNWGKYKIFIQTNNGGTGSTTDPWGRAIACGGGFSPQYCLSCWVDSGGGFNYHHWNGSSWDSLGSGATFAISGAGNGGQGGVEWALTRSSLGTPSTIQIQGTCTGGGGGDNGQDAVPSQANATDWGTVTTLSTPTSAITVPVGVSGFTIE